MREQNCFDPWDNWSLQKRDEATYLNYFNEKVRVEVLETESSFLEPEIVAKT